MSGYSFFARFYDILTGNIDYAERARYFDGLIKKFGGRQGGILLDLACGTGTLSDKFARLGYDVIGVDNSVDMLNIALGKKIETGLDIRYICQDMRELDLYGNPDIVICALDSLNHLDGAADIRKAFERVSLFLSEGSLFIFDMNTPYKHREILGNETFVYETERVFCVWQNEFTSDAENRVNISLDFFENTENNNYKRFSEDFSEIALPIQTVKSLLEETGFELLAAYDYDSEKPITDKSEKFVAVARRKEKGR